MWFQETEGAKFWLQVLTELRQRGVHDVLICCVDGLKGFPEAIEAVFPQAWVQTCIVHLIRHSLRYVPRREREQVARDLKPIYTAADADAAAQALEALRREVGHALPGDQPGVAERLGAGDPVHGVPAGGAAGDLHHECDRGAQPPARKAIKTKGHFPNEDAARKLIYLAITNAVPAWTKTRNWTAALLAFKIHFGDRLPD